MDKISAAQRFATILSKAVSMGFKIDRNTDIYKAFDTVLFAAERHVIDYTPESEVKQEYCKMTYLTRPTNSTKNQRIKYNDNLGYHIEIIGDLFDYSACIPVDGKVFHEMVVNSLGEVIHLYDNAY